MLEPGLYLGDCRELLPGVDSGSVRLVHTSPPYNIGKDYLDYEDKLETEEYLSFITEVVDECFRVLVDGGSLFWQTGYTTNGDGYIYPLDHITSGIFENKGFKLKDRIIWRYFGGMSFKQKFTNKHETILWWVKPGAEAFFDVFPVRERAKELDPRNNLFGRNPGNVWEVDRVAFGSAEQTSHIAVFPEEISDRIILSASMEDEVCLDPFSGSGTLCKTAKSRGRRFLGFEISEDYYNESVDRIGQVQTDEFSNVLSEIIYKHIMRGNKYYTTDMIISGVSLLYGADRYGNLKGFMRPDVINSIKNKNETSVTKAEKKELWKSLSNYFASDKYRNDIVRLVDEAYLERYKIHKRFNGPMRLYKALSWLDKFEKWQSIAEPDKTDYIKSLVGNETARYSLNEGLIKTKDKSVSLGQISTEELVFERYK
jgi:adenine-specific DNA-methyltransferase